MHKAPQTGHLEENNCREDFSFTRKKEKESLLKGKKQVIFTEAVPAVPQCARSKSASRADVLQAVDKTHPPASKRDTADSSFIIIHIIRPHKVWLPDEERECVLLWVRHVSIGLCACARSVLTRIQNCIHGNLASGF